MAHFTDIENINSEWRENKLEVMAAKETKNSAAVSTQTYIMYTAHKQANEKQILQCLLLDLFDIFKSCLGT